MLVARVPPGPRLARIVRHFTVVEAAEEATRVLLPEPGLVLGLRWAGSATQIGPRVETPLANATVTGVLGATRTIRTSAGGGLVVAAFHEDGAARLFGEPLQELFGRTVSLDELMPRASVARALERMQDARDRAGRVAALADSLASALRPTPPDPLVSRAVRILRASHGAVRIREIAARLEIRLDPLEKRFRRAVGTSPKHLATLLRFQFATDAVRAGVSLTRVAHDAGYFDQSHFIRDFRALTGASPRKFFLQTAHC